MLLSLFFFVAPLFASQFTSAYQDEEEEEDELDLDPFYETLTPAKIRDPIVIVPGLAGSHLEYRNITRSNETESNETGSGWGNLWLNFARTLPIVKKDYIKDLAVTYDPATDTYTSAKHLEARPADFGGIKGIDYLDPLIKTVTRSMHPVIKALSKIGYVPGKDLFGAPYDWRLANARQVRSNGMFQAFKELIEKVSAQNNGSKVHLLGHSCGCIFTRLFLTTYVDDAWKAKYVDSFFSVAGPYGGSFEAFGHLASPRKWAVPTLTANDVHKLVGNFGSLYWMLPNTNGYNPDYVVARILSRNQIITIQNMTAVFSTTGRYEKQKAMENTQRYINQNVTAPHVRTHIFYAIGQSTAKELVYEKGANDWWTYEAKTIYGDGDGTVPIESLRVPLRWATEQKEPVTVAEIKQQSHTSILGDKNFLLKLIEVLTADD